MAKLNEGAAKVENNVQTVQRKVFTVEMDREIVCAVSADRKFVLIDGKPYAGDPITVQRAVIDALGLERPKRAARKPKNEAK